LKLAPMMPAMATRDTAVTQPWLSDRMEHTTFTGLHATQRIA
jgi:hypothetical protein